MEIRILFLIALLLNSLHGKTVKELFKDLHTHNVSKISKQIENTKKENKDLFSKINFKKFIKHMKESESTGRAYVINNYGFIGYFQLGVAVLEDMGYVKKGEYRRMKKLKVVQKTFIKKYVRWNKGLTLNKFLKYKQSEAFKKLCRKNYRSLLKYGFLKKVKDKRVLQGYLFSSHLLGLTATKRWIKGVLPKNKQRDANGMHIATYYKRGYGI